MQLKDVTMSRRAYLVDSWVKPIIFIYIAAHVSSWWTRRDEKSHRISISIIRSNNGVETSESELNEVDVIMGEKPIATPGIQATEYFYSAVIRNNGDFTEELLLVQAKFDTEGSNLFPVHDITIDSSSNLLRQTVELEIPSDSEWLYMLRVPRMTSDEWVSLSTTWPSPVRFIVEARSREVAEAESV